jgi:hypothetical protein
MATNNLPVLFPGLRLVLPLFLGLSFFSSHKSVVQQFIEGFVLVFLQSPCQVVGSQIISNLSNICCINFCPVSLFYLCSCNVHHVSDIGVYQTDFETSQKIQHSMNVKYKVLAVFSEIAH